MGVVSFDVQASARRLETAFPLHTDEGMRSFLEKLQNLEELKYFAGDYDVSIWLVDFYESLWKVNLSPSEQKVIYYLYFEGYKQSELVQMMGLKKNTIHTLLTRAVGKLVAHYEAIRLAEIEEHKASMMYGHQLARGE